MKRAVVPGVVAVVVAGALASTAHGGASELKKALADARAAASAGNADALDRALRAALAEGGKPPVKALLELASSFPADKEPLYWQVVGGVASVHDRGGLDALGDHLSASPDAPLSRDLMLALQGNRSTEVLELYRRLLKRGSGALQVAAVDRTGELERPEAVDLLLEVYERESGSGSALERRVKTTLTGLFGADLGVYANYESYWAQNRDRTFAPKEGGGGGTGTVKDHMDKARQGGLSSMQRGGKVLVLRGQVRNFDEIEKMLARLGVKHEVMRKIDFNELDFTPDDQRPHPLDNVAAIILNCSFAGRLCTCRTCKPGHNPTTRLPVCTQCDKHEYMVDELDDESIQAIRAFVKQGGCLFTEDLGLKELTGKAWPELVKAGPDMPEREIDYAPVRGQADPSLLRGVFVQRDGAGESMTARRSARWKIDNLSPRLIVKDPASVQVLLASDELKADSPEPNGNAVAIAFSPGAPPPVAPAPGGRRGPRTGGGKGTGAGAPRVGLVLHVLSHFGHQTSQSDEFTLQNLLVNFLLDAQERYSARKPSPRQ